MLDILEETMADGPGLRTSIYSAGCFHKCPGCHNPHSWDPMGGKEMSVDELFQIIISDEFANVSFTGGDPFYQVEGFTELAKRIKAETSKTIWCWSGFTLEEIKEDPKLATLLPYLDVLVDGPYVQELADKELHFRGSSNQRIIYLRGDNIGDYAGNIVEELPGATPIKPYK